MIMRILFVFCFLFVPFLRVSAKMDWSQFKERRYFYITGSGELGAHQKGDLLGQTDATAVSDGVIRYKRPLVGAGVGFGYCRKMLRFEHIWGFRSLKDRNITQGNFVTQDNDFCYDAFTSINTVYLDLPINESWVPFVGIGGGFCRFDFNTATLGANTPAAVTFSAVDHIQFCGEISAGLAYRANDRFDLFGGYAFIFSDPTYSRDHSLRIDGLRIHALRFGLRYAFR